MSQPTLSRVQVSPFADVLVLANVADAPDVTVPSGRTVRVRALEVRYFFDFGTCQWSHIGKLMGRRVHRDGTLGHVSGVNYSAIDETMPAWFADFIRERTPQILPDLRVSP